jgi:hypothetical protein
MTDTALPKVHEGIFTNFIVTIIGLFVFLCFFGVSASVIGGMLEYQKAEKKTLCIRKIGDEQGGEQE